MKRKNYTINWPILIGTILLTLGIIYVTSSKYFSSLSATVNLTVRRLEYTVEFHSNRNDGNPDDVTSQNFIYGIAQKLNKNTFTKTDYNFAGWNTEADGSGTSYYDEEEVLNLASSGTVDLYARWEQGVAIIEGDPTPYYTLQAAIDAVPADNTVKTIKLLTNVSEVLTIAKDKNIVFNLQNYTVSNNGNTNVIKNNGTIVISNGKITTNATGSTNNNILAIVNNSTGSITINGGEITVTGTTNAGSVIRNMGALTITNGSIRTSAATNGAINNESTGTITISGGEIIVTGKRQALYNDKGIAYISGNAYLSSSSSERAAVQNQASGTLTITGGTIISTSANGGKGAVQNSGTMTIGTEDGNANISSLTIQGEDYGVMSSTNFAFYDGTIKGVTKAISDQSKVTSQESGYDVANSEEIIDGKTYKTAYLALTNTVTFNPNGGTISEPTRNVENGKAVGTLPVPEREGYVFDGWFTLASGGTEITAGEIITADIEFFAHWTLAIVAKIGNTEYYTLQEAINAAQNNTETTIQLLKDVRESVTINSNKNIVFDLQNYSITNKGDSTVIENNGKVKILNGTITSNAATKATINNNSGAILKITGGEILSTGTRSAVYNDKGTVEISGNAYLSSTASGTPNGRTLERGTVHNLTGGTVTITGGTIVGINQNAVSNDGGILNIGIKDGIIDNTSPVLEGKVYGVKTTGTFNFYDGIIKGKTDAIDGTISDQEDNTQVVSGTDGDYKTSWLESTQ